MQCQKLKSNQEFANIRIQPHSRPKHEIKSFQDATLGLHDALNGSKKSSARLASLVHPMGLQRHWLQAEG